SFVIHDIKNVSGQLGLMIANFRKFGGEAEFRADMIRGLEGAAKKLRVLMDKLKPDVALAERAELVDLGGVIAEVVSELNREDAPVRAEMAGKARQVRMAPADLHAALTHLVTNAQEASVRGDEVVVSLEGGQGKVVVEVADRGCGMSAEFIRNSLFVPLDSTKPRGHGMGAYQARSLVRAAGGEVEVVSAVGRGTTIRIVLPEASAATGAMREVLAS
ncbi:MAG TPA: ATP-binding protein, partial [Rhizomicrobium sp.]|nr:ATP-binding protein [Rhizomicrobium sp.]